MRPLRMTMMAFGPYKDREVIDFSPLDQNRIFVISGKTGAGKTSIFDAICYALFGTASGQDREDSRMLRSHFARDVVYTSVDLVFEIKNKCYRIYRQMPHQKAGNKSETGGKVELYEVKDGGNEPLLDKFTSTEVKHKIENLLGLNRDQFIQIVMLPQGEFRKLLTSETENKEEILRRIFKTDFYQKVQERFHSWRKQVHDQWLKQKSDIEARLSQIQERLPEREGARLFSELAEDAPSVTSVLEGLDEERKRFEMQAEKKLLESQHLTLRIQQEETKLAHAKEWEKRFRLLEEKKQMYSGLMSQRQDYEKMAKRLEWAQKAAELAPFYEQWKKALIRLEEKKESCHNQSLKTKTVEKNVEWAEKTYAAEERKEDERKELEREVERLESLMPKINSWREREIVIDKREQRIKQMNGDISRLEKELEQAKNAKEQTVQEISQLEQTVARLPEHTTTLGTKRQHQEWLDELQQAFEKLNQYRKHYDEAKEHVKDKRRAYEQMEQRWLDGQAALLAEQLHDGQACPVCGSIEHPHKAATVHAQVITKDMIDRTRSEWTEWESILTRTQTEVAVTTENKKDYEGRLHKFDITLDQHDQIRVEVEKLEREVERIHALRPVLEQKKVQLNRWNELMEQKSEAKEKKLKQLHEEHSILQTERTVLNRERAEWLRDDEDFVQIEQKLTSLRKRFAQALQSWKQVQFKRQEAREQLAREKATLERLFEEWQEARIQLKEVEEDWVDRLTLSGISGEEAFTQALVEPAVREQWKSSLETYNKEVNTLRSVIAEEEKWLSAQNRPDLVQLEKQLEKLRGEEEVIRRKQLESEKWAASAQQIHAKLKESSQTMEKYESELTEISAVYDVMKGDNPLKLSFERYILIEFLDQILGAANERLFKLTQGQFYLQRSDRLERHKRQSGLGLDVYDAYTGLARDVKTLSGGEKFNASLALALGMTDVIQSHQGGVSIEMMFIDEGFGSLDEEALHQAIDTMVELQQAGRMIGVISHVEELKKSFPAILEVAKTKAGYSRTRWQLTGM